ncbi:methyltransferase domain-containing protein [Aidingimonas lacisalsi]|uniref:methyltransferase domain-containing protein n=1 Tax=Aidingimonas lacisalsi TaxID=2604086 RepID=UPI0011D270A7|nr:methyltransferase domain-containing protein [Aidingimonas lacisalsi]
MKPAQTLDSAHDQRLGWRRRVAHAFDRAAPHYEQRASAQHVMGERLWTALPEHAHRILDLGCGPGGWTAALASRYPDAALVGLDLSPVMLEHARHTHGDRIGWLCADAAHPPLADQQFDLLFSNLTIQWCPDMAAVFAGLHRLLAARGCALINTLVPGTLTEIDHAWSLPDRPAALLALRSAESYRDQARLCGFEHIRLDQRTYRFHYPTFAAVMASIKGVGAQVSRPGARLTRRDLDRATQRYERLREPHGLPVTYQCLTLTLTKS